METIASHESEVGILAPGPEKLANSKSSILWKQAMNAISAAHEVYLVGYRFPDTDLFAQYEIGKALDKNVGTHPHKDVSIILGCDQSMVAVRRCVEIARGLGRNNRVEALPFGCSEFFLKYANDQYDKDAKIQ